MHLSIALELRKSKVVKIHIEFQQFSNLTPTRFPPPRILFFSPNFVYEHRSRFSNYMPSFKSIDLREPTYKFLKLRIFLSMYTFDTFN